LPRRWASSRHHHLRLQHPNETQTLPSAIYTFTQVPGGDDGALRLTLISIIISMAALVPRKCWRGASVADDIE